MICKYIINKYIYICIHLWVAVSNRHPYFKAVSSALRNVRAEWSSRAHFSCRCCSQHATRRILSGTSVRKEGREIEIDEEPWRCSISRLDEKVTLWRKGPHPHLNGFKRKFYRKHQETIVFNLQIWKFPAGVPTNSPRKCRIIMDYRPISRLFATGLLIA